MTITPSDATTATARTAVDEELSTRRLNIMRVIDARHRLQLNPIGEVEAADQIHLPQLIGRARSHRR